MDKVKEIRETAEKLLREKKVDVVIGYGEGSLPNRPRAIFITKPEDANKLVWNRYCFYNLTLYLVKQEVTGLGKMAVVVKGCDARTIVVFEKESQINRDDITVIGVTCDGVGEPLENKCLHCDVHNPEGCDILIGEKIDNKEILFEEKYADVIRIAKMSLKDRWEFWEKQFSKCIKCYACSKICPLCYCGTCIVEKNQPQWIDTSAHNKGNFAWNLVRAFHLAGRCIGCGECDRACPKDIPLNLINKELAMEIEKEFNFRAGYDANDELAMITYKEDDKADFIK
ncbi:MAG: 4Fe-4S dicluster domain-containing protein [Candidatus Anammoxibacter sp.]